MTEDSGMLDDEARENIRIVRKIAENIWDGKCSFGDIKVTNSPYAEFIMPLILYNSVNVILTYDRSILGIAIKQEGGEIWLDDLTTQLVYDGFESCKPENIEHNFKILDTIAREIINREI